jgi:glycerol-3-phosphate responsive antiterminator
MIPGLKITPFTCDICLAAKMTTLPFKNSFAKADGLLSNLHLDLVGPIHLSTKSGFRFFLTVVDQYSGYKHTALLKSKLEGTARIQEFIITSENQLQKNVKRVHSDGGGEFVNTILDNFLRNKGIIHSVSAPYPPPNV